jgi:glyoxylase-like metal-dependent hydrolase (beta-lactamase superfamily II)
MILEILEVGPFATNCYIVGTVPGGQGIIIDPGGDPDKILARTAKLELDIKHIVLTHGHPDHVAALKEVEEATGADIAIHSEDAIVLGDRTISTVLGYSYDTPPVPDRLLGDGDVISPGELTFIVIHTPGHTPGSICLLGEGVLFSGDTLFKSGIGRADLPGGDNTKLMKSIQSRLMMLDDKVVVYPGHGQRTTIGAERRGNPFL